MVQSPTLRWSVCLIFFTVCLVDVAWGRRFNALSPILKTFRNRKRQGGTPGPVPPSSIPSTSGYPGLGPCVWASTNVWEGCGLNHEGALGFNSSNCNLPTANVVGLAPPYKNCVAIAWFKFEDWANSDYQASTPTIPLSQNYNYAISISANVILNWAEVYNGKSGSKNYDKVASQTINNKTTIFSFKLSRDGIVHFDFKYDYGHPSGNVTLWQQPKDLNSVASYASLSSLSSSTSHSYPLVSTAFTITTETRPVISLGLNSSISSAPQSPTSTSSYDALDVNLNSTESLPNITPATMSSAAMSMATIANSSTPLSSMPPPTMNSTAISMAPTINSSTSLLSVSSSSLPRNATVSAYVAYTLYSAHSTSTMNSTTVSFMPNVSTTVLRTTMNRFSPIPSTRNNITQPLTRPPVPSNSSVLAPSTKSTNSSSTLRIARPTNSSAIVPSRPSSTPAASTSYNSTIVFGLSSSRLSSSSQTFLSNTSFALQETPSLLTNNPPSTIAALTIDPPSTSAVLTIDPSSTSAVLTIDPPSTLAVLTVDPPSTSAALTIDPPSTSVALPSESPSTSAALTIDPPSTPIFTAASPSAALDGIPLWGQCGPGIGQVCAGGAQCICKDQYWSQCRIQMDGLWAPRGGDWDCSGPAAVRGQPGTTVAASAALVNAGPILPLWYACGRGVQGTCAQGTECICQNSYYSQCRVPINGVWAGGSDWECTSPGQVVAAT